VTVSDLTGKMFVVIDHLRDQGFTVGQTERGFVAVDDDGVIFTCSPGRTMSASFTPRTASTWNTAAMDCLTSNGSMTSRMKWFNSQRGSDDSKRNDSA